MSIQKAIRSVTTKGVLLDRGEAASVPGLELRVTPHSSTWYCRYRFQGLRRAYRLGVYPAISLNDARKVAKDLLVRVARGEDPSQERQEERAEATVQELWDEMKLEYFAGLGSRWGLVEAPSLYRTKLAKVFGKLKLSQVTRGLVVDWHSKLVRHSAYRANRALAVLRKMFSWADDRGRLLGKNPCAGVESVTEIARSRRASSDELRRIDAALEAEAATDPHGAGLLRCLLLTGARPKSLLEATWSDLEIGTVDGERCGLLVFHGKSTSRTGDLEQVVLPPAALAIVEALPRSATDARIFQYALIPRALWHRVRKAAGCEDLRARDLRRTFASIGLNAGEDKATVGKLLNHRSSQTTDVYARLEIVTRVKSATRITNKVADILASGEKKNPATEAAGPG